MKFALGLSPGNVAFSLFWFLDPLEVSARALYSAILILHSLILLQDCNFTYLNSLDEKGASLCPGLWLGNAMDFSFLFFSSWRALLPQSERTTQWKASSEDWGSMKSWITQKQELRMVRSGTMTGFVVAQPQPLVSSGTVCRELLFGWSSLIRLMQLWRKQHYFSFISEETGIQPNVGALAVRGNAFLACRQILLPPALLPA